MLEGLGMVTQAVGYLRVSSKGQLKGTGLDDQQKAVERFAEKNGLEMVRFYKDAKTGTTEERDEFARMLADLIANGVKTIVVDALDRLARDLNVQLLLLAKLESEGITLLNALTGDDVTAAMRDDPMKKAMVQIQGVFAELEKNLLVRKLKRSRTEKRNEQGRCEGRKPFGATKTEENTLHRIKQLRRKPRGQARKSFGAVAKILNEEGHQTRTGKPWNRGTVWAICQRLDA
tara:strand:- start:2601 stop:3296 length:696 start_codon:yes stop_codon:yes gene_type:complete